MAIFEVTEEGLRRLVESVPVRCDGCGKQAVKVMRCRVMAAAHRLHCDACLAQLEAAVASIGHVHCTACGAVGATIHDIADIFDL